MKGVLTMICKRTQSDYFRMNNNIFDYDTDETGTVQPKLSAVELRVLAELYSLAPFKTYRVKVRQSTLAEKCKCSVSTIKRAVALLLEKHYIKSMARDEIYAGDLKLLGTYTYVLPPIVKKGYFYVNRKALELLNKIQARVYLFLCKCSRKTMDCWNSFSDIAKKLGLHRNAVVKTIKDLIEKNVIQRTHNKKKDGSFSDNSYTIEDVETNRINSDFAADFFSDNDTSEKEIDCRVESTAANNRTEIRFNAHSKPNLIHSLQCAARIVNTFPHISSGFFYCTADP